MVGAHRRPGGGGVVHGGQYMHAAARVGPEVVPLVEAGELCRKSPGGRMVRILDPDARVLLRRVLLEVGTDQPAVPGPGETAVGRGVNADEPAAVLDIALEGGLFLWRADRVSGGGQEDHGRVPGQVGVGE